MEKEIKSRCGHCKNYVAYYTKGHTTMNRTDCGFCNLQQKIVSTHNCCQYWRCGRGFLWMKKTALAKLLRDINAQLAIVGQIIEDDQIQRTK